MDRKRSASMEPVVILDDGDKTEPLSKLLKLDRDKFRTIQSEMRTKGLVLSQTWSDLFGLMSKYQAELITRQDQLIGIESQIETKKRNIHEQSEFEKMKLQLQAKDREIKTVNIDLINKSELLVRTQNELGRLKSDLVSKDCLIQKLQHQMQNDDCSGMDVTSPTATLDQVRILCPASSLTNMFKD
jgi:chromosome segregation ATPase